MTTANQMFLQARTFERKGQIESARALYQSILQSFPANTRARRSLADLDRRHPGRGEEPAQEEINALVLLVNRGAPAAAAAQAEQLLEGYPRSLALWNLLGLARASAGATGAAEEAFRRALELAPGMADIHSNLGNALQQQGRIDDAIESFRRALQLRPDYPEAQNNLGNALRDKGATGDAIACYRRAIALRGDYVEAQVNLGAALRQRGDLDEAIEAYRRAVEIRPNFALAETGLGTALKERGQYEEAVEAHRLALKHQPDHVGALKELGVALDGLGRFEEAAAVYRRVLEVAPGEAEAYRRLGALVKFAPGAPEIAAMERIHDGAPEQSEARGHICFALAKAQENLGDLAQCFAYLSEGNAVRKAQLGYDGARDRAIFAAIRASADRIDGAKVDFAADPAPVVPVFVLGMPRSGTTLVEQVISSHSGVHGAGELPYATRYGEGLATGRTAITAGGIARFRAQYLDQLARRSGGAGFVTDKMPDNFRFIGLIAKALPEARIVHVARDARAVCWSNFRQYFAGAGLGFSYDLGDAVAYYRLYEGLMAFWEARLGDRVYRLNYEALTENQETETRRLIAHLGLDWQEACLHPQKNARGVATASRRQIREKLYRGSSAEWRRFEPFLGGAFAALGS